MNFSNLLRRLLGRGRRRHFFVSPYVRQLKKMFEKHPLVMNAVTYGTLCTGAELSQQTLKYYYSASTNRKSSTVAHVVSKHHMMYELGQLCYWMNPTACCCFVLSILVKR